MGNNTKREKCKFYSVKIRDHKQRINGILVNEGEEWVLLNYLLMDYLLDGYIFVNKKYIELIERTESEVFTEKVLLSNNKIHVSKNFKIPLVTEELLEWIYDTQLVIEIENKDESMSWIGKIWDMTEKSIFITDLTPKGIWTSSHYTFRKNSIRLIYFDTDYINSLLKYSLTL